MISLWRDEEADCCRTPLALRVYSSRLLGRDPSLVLHGGGNTSVKVSETNLFGEEEQLLYIKGSGWDLATIEEAGFAPVRLEPLLRLATLDRLSDPEMVNALRSHTIRADAPAPSIETILHALLPFRYVDHTHADAVVTVTNSAAGEELVHKIWGDRVVVIPYVMPGFDLARICRERFERDAHAGTIGMVLLNHGIFSFGDDAKESYERMIELVTMAEEAIDGAGAWALPPLAEGGGERPALRESRAALRKELSAAAGRPMIVSWDDRPAPLAFCRRSDLEQIANHGPATPDHIIRTKQLPMIGRDVAGYAGRYRDYFERQSQGIEPPLTMLDPAPRVVLDREFGIGGVGKRAGDATIVADIYRHTRVIIERAERLGGYRALSEAELFAVEYWDLEQAKLARAGSPPRLAGEVALVTGGASGIGRACVDSLLARGAAVVAIDRDPSIESLPARPDLLPMVCDVTDCSGMESVLEAAAAHFGGMDILILNAGLFPASTPIASLTQQEWRRVMAVNLDANQQLLGLVYPLLCKAPSGGRVVAIGSRNVTAPGPGAAAYSASKAALNQLMRVAALEWARDRIRVNSLHPDAVFDTAIWSEEVLAGRASHYGMSIEEYKRRNLLRCEVSSHQVAELAAELCGPLFAATTGAQIPVDGGNERVI